MASGQNACSWNTLMQLANVSFVCRFHTRLDRFFFRLLGFPATSKNRDPSTFLVHSFWFLVECVQSLLGCLGFNYLRVRCGYHTTMTTAPRESSRLISRALQKLLVIIIIYYYPLTSICHDLLLRNTLCTLATLVHISAAIYTVRVKIGGPGRKPHYGLAAATTLLNSSICCWRYIKGVLQHPTPLLWQFVHFSLKKKNNTLVTSLICFL